MGISRRMFTREFKLAAVKEVESGKSVGYVARRLEINPNMLHRWRQDLRILARRFPATVSEC
jgi:transposase-like protein